MNPYELLEIPPDASDKDIKDAYKQMALKWHPDKNKSPDAEEKFKMINKAYNILKTPELRKRYDKTGSVDEQQVPQDVDINEIFRGMGGGFPFPIPGMGGMRGFPGGFPGMMGGMPGGMMFVNGQPVHMGGGMNPQEMFMRQNLNIKMTMEVNMVDLFSGIKKNVEYQYKNLETGEMKRDIIEINIVKGSFEGQELMFKNKGHQFKDMRGDIFIKIKEIPHKDFIRNTNAADLIYTLKINLVQSICGFEVIIKGIDGQKLIIKNFEKIIKNGDKKTIKEQGMYALGSNNRGNLIIMFEVEYPDHLSEDMRNKLAEIFEYDNKSKYTNANTNGYVLCELSDYIENTETEHTEQGERMQCAQQ
jgi:DnaJ-class molecular chaperone